MHKSITTRLIPLSGIISPAGKLGNSRSWLYGEIAKGGFPKPVKVGARSMWVEAEVDAYIASCIALRDGNTRSVRAMVRADKITTAIATDMKDGASEGRADRFLSNNSDVEANSPQPKNEQL